MDFSGKSSEIISVFGALGSTVDTSSYVSLR